MIGCVVSTSGAMAMSNLSSVERIALALAMQARSVAGADVSVCECADDEGKRIGATRSQV